IGGALIFLGRSGPAPGGPAAKASASDAMATESIAVAGGQELSLDTLTRLKKMTVFVKADFGIGESQGSGFLVKVEDRNGYIVTNDHVARGDPSRDGLPGRPSPRAQPRRIS